LVVAVVGVVLLFSKEFFFIAFDQKMAEASGVPARRLFFLLLSLVALTIVVSLKTAGAILVFALLLIPPSTAYQLTSSLRGMMGYSVVIGILVSCAGVLLSFRFDLPTGPAIVLLATAVFFLSVAFSPKRLRRLGPA
jgi:ABC-type Mn2+/Zn2+ transport system permease subunit